MTDARDVAVGAALQQCVDGSWQPLAFFSRKLTSTESNYSTFGRELLAAYMAVRHFRHFLEARSFFIATGYKPLTFAIKSASSKFSPRESRHLTYISEFTTDIRHVQGSANAAADALSGLTLSVSCAASSTTVDFSALAAAQAQDAEIAKLRLDAGTLKVREVILPSSTVPILCDMSNGSPRPLVPSDFRRAVFDSLHGLSHPGIRATQHLITWRFV